MVFGNRGFSVALLAIGTIIFCWVLLLAMSAPSGAQSGGGSTGGTTRASDNDDRNQNRRVIIIEEPTVEEQTVIIRTIPRKGLPPTGGLPVYVMVGGSVLTGAGLLAGRLVTQRGRQR